MSTENQGREHDRRIERFAQKNSLQLATFKHYGKKFLYLDLPGVAPLDRSRMDAYLTQRLKNERAGLHANQCFDVARAVVKAGVSVGRIAGQETRPLAFWDNHCINYDAAPDDTVVGLDFTAAETVDRYRDRFHVFGLRARSLGALVTQLGELYGGRWAEL